MKSLMSLTQSVLADAGIWCCTSTTRDFETVTRRVKHEGVSFLTMTLPSFCRDFESCLDKGYVSSTDFLSFKKTRALPSFLKGLLGLVFDSSSGLLLNIPSTDAIFYIRQITLMFKKILLPCSKRRERKAYAGYIKCESEVTAWNDSATSEQLLARFGLVADVLWGPDLSIIDRKVYDVDHVPRHGPGATADRISGNRKFDLRSWTHRLEDYFPSTEFLIPNQGYYRGLDDVDFAEPGSELPVRVITVPKTLKTPRIIAIEPACMMYAQQSILEILVEQLERSDVLSGALGFSDQLPNQRLAQKGSISGNLATIDLSEASDRVSNQLVKRMLRNFPTLSGAVQASRSTRADVPGYGIIPLAKFASMGSALCFPIEAMVFLTIVVLSKEQMLNKPLLGNALKRFLKSVRIYGDDIIVPVDLVPYVVRNLEAYCLKVNVDKSFWTGKFRESCGKDYYGGCDVSVTYIRRLLPSRRSDVQEILSSVSTRNQFYRAGLWRTADFLDTKLGRLAPFPNVLETSPVQGRNSFLGFSVERSCPVLHRPLVKGLVVKAVPRKSVLDGRGALMKFFIKRGTLPIFDPKHLERYGRPEYVDTKIRWASPV